MTAIVDVLAMLVILLLASPAHADVIAAAARDEGAAVIVVGSHGRPEPTGLLVGSVAERVDRVAGCTVIVVKQPPEPMRKAIATRSG